MLGPEALLPLERVVSAMAAVRRARLLDGAGTVLVEEGRRVEPGTVVAAEEQSQVHVLDAARLLGVAPGRVADLLLVPVGETVAEGQPLARKSGLFSRTIVSPVDGMVTLVDGRGRLLLRGHTERRELRALMHGQVVGVVPERGVEIEAHGALVQGAWGNGQESAGLIRLMVSHAGESVAVERINVGMQGSILIAGATLDEAALANAHDAEVRGLVAASMEARLVPLAQQLPFPILLTEGFGQYPFCPPVFEVLQRLNNREATLNACFEPGSRTRPELFVPLQGQGAPVASPGPLSSGDRVRLLAEPYLGQIGTVEAGESTLHALPSGLLATACTVRLDSGATLSIPFTNLERLIS
ncbi:MAG TPA: hypothetical protein VF707_00330 [Ardenticatenaceae bacterium]|jgi:hypothetical protein